MATQTDAGGKRHWKVPNTFTIIFAVLLFAAAATWVVSAVSPEVRPATLADITTAPFLGFVDAVQVCLFVLVLGGFIGLVNKTGALDAGIGALVRWLGGRDLALIPVLMLLFGICGSTYGMSEATVPFYILLASVTFAVGYDTMVGALIVLFGAGLGCVGATVNPFSVGIAGASLVDSGIEINQGIIIPLGLLLFVIAEALGIAFVMRYAIRVKRDPASSALSSDERRAAMEAFAAERTPAQVTQRLTGRQKVVLALFALTFVVMIISFIPWESFGVMFFTLGATADDPSTAWSAVLTGVPLGQWYFIECCAWFFVMSLAVGIVARMGEQEFIETFIAGASDLVSVALIIAVSRGISVLMSSTGMDTWLLATSAEALEGVPAALFAPASFALYALLSFLVPSSSGLASVSMPVMGPLTAGLGFSPEVMVMIFSAANALMVMILPVNGASMAGLELAKTSYASYIKLTIKFLIVLLVLTCAVLTVAMMVC